MDSLTGRITSSRPNIQDTPRGPMPSGLLHLILMEMDVPQGGDSSMKKLQKFMRWALQRPTGYVEVTRYCPCMLHDGEFVEYSPTYD